MKRGRLIVAAVAWSAAAALLTRDDRRATKSAGLDVGVRPADSNAAPRPVLPWWFITVSAVEAGVAGVLWDPMAFLVLLTVLIVAGQLAQRYAEPAKAWISARVHRAHAEGVSGLASVREGLEVARHRVCESCMIRPARGLVVVSGEPFAVCDTCRPEVPAEIEDAG